MVKDAVSYAQNNGFKLNLEFYGDVNIIVAKDATLSVQGEINGGTYRPFQQISDTLSIYGQASHAGTVKAGKVSSDMMTLYSGSMTADAVDVTDTVSIKGGTLAVSGNVSAGKVDISGGTTTISGTARMEYLTLGCRTLYDSICITGYESGGEGTKKYADGQTLTDGTEKYSGLIYNNTWPHGKTLRKFDDRAAQTITAEDMTVTYGDTGRSVSGTTDGDGAISYAVKDVSKEYIDVDSATGALSIKKAGTAAVIVTAAGTQTYKPAVREVTVTVNRANAAAATVTANNRTYDGTEKPLVTVDESTLDGGTMQYAPGTKDAAADIWKESIPTGAGAGTYYVWYRVKGDANYLDSAPACVTVIIRNELYTVLKVENAEHTINSGENAVITVKRSAGDDRTFSLYTGAAMDGTPIASGNCDTAAGSLILTLKSFYLDSLSVGDHKLTISFQDGSVDTTVKILPAASVPTATPKPIPKTGDSANPALWLGLIFLGLLGAAGTILVKARKR